MFYGKRFFSWHWQTGKEKKVVVAWKIYLDNLATDTTGWAQTRQEIHYGDRIKQFNALLTAIGAAVDYEFDEVHIEKAGYIPVAHNDNESKQLQLLDSAVNVLQGKQPLKMEVLSFPTNPQVAEDYQKVIAQIAAITEGGALKVSNT